MQREYSISGMSCAACASRVQKAVSSVEGVIYAHVELMRNTCSVEFDEKIADDMKIISAVKKAGYGADIAQQGNLYKENNSTLKPLRLNLLVSIALTFTLMLISMGPMFSFVIFENAFTSACVQGVIALLVMKLQKHYFISALKALRNLSTNMDTLVSMGSLASFIYSIYSLGMIEPNDSYRVLSSTHPVFFEGAAGILTFVAVGKYLEAVAKYRTTSAVSALYDLVPKNAVIRDSEGNERTVALSEVKTGDVLIFRQGQRLGVDGIVVSGSGHTDESAITGESRAVKKSVSSKVVSASVLTDGYLEVKAQQVGTETTLSKIIKLVESTALSKVSVTRIADRVASYFVPAVILISALTFCYWFIIYGISLDKALSFAVSVLVISCPCALGLATPAAVMAGTGRAAREGIIFKEPAALEILGTADTFAFDKTGTLTFGYMSVSEVICDNDSYDKDSILKIAAALESLSSHPIARAVSASAVSEYKVTDFKTIKGQGISGCIDNTIYYLGNEKLLEQNQLELSSELKEKLESRTQKGKIVVILANAKKALALICLDDRLKADAPLLVSKLRENGLSTLMLTGDNTTTALCIGKTLCFNDIGSQLLPEDKLNRIRELRKKGHRVVMVGDGINDSASLCEADVGIGLKGSTDIAISSCDVVLLKERLIDVYNAFVISRYTMRNIRENLVWAFIYNVIAIPVACGLFYLDYHIALNPMLCSLLMGLSSVCVVTNALRLGYLKLDATLDENILKAEQNNVKSGFTMNKTVNIEGMMCKHCAANVKKTLEGLDGVTSCEVSLEDNRAVIELSRDIDEKTIKDAISEAGYRVTEISR